MFSHSSPLYGDNRQEPVLMTGSAPEGSIEQAIGIANHSMRHSEVGKFLLKRRSLMKRFNNTRTIMLTIVLLLGAIPAAAIERPFALNGKGVAALITDGAGNVIGANVTASGTATHLGLWTTAGSVRYTPDENGVLHSSGEATITAADGDKLDVVVEGVLDPVTFTDHGTFRFVGGTGRFEGASGSSDFVVTLNTLSDGFELTLVGRINF
jgi:hypothetical protein